MYVSVCVCVCVCVCVWYTFTSIMMYYVYIQIMSCVCGIYIYMDYDVRIQIVSCSHVYHQHFLQQSLPGEHFPIFGQCYREVSSTLQLGNTLMTTEVHHLTNKE